MAARGRFIYTSTDAAFVISEMPANAWATTREAVWELARSQDKPVIVKLLDGRNLKLGVRFNPRSFERTLYAGYVGYGVSTSDGYYAPIDEKTWVALLRREAQQGNVFTDGNDAPRWVLASAQSYLSAVQALAASNS